MGARFRLKASIDLSQYGARTRVVLRAMQTYGLVLADNGSPWYFQGDASAKWPSKLISELKQVPARAFVAVDTSSLMVDPDSARVERQLNSSSADQIRRPGWCGRRGARRSRAVRHRR